MGPAAISDPNEAGSEMDLGAVVWVKPPLDETDEVRTTEELKSLLLLQMTVRSPLGPIANLGKYPVPDGSPNVARLSGFENGSAPRAGRVEIRTPGGASAQTTEVSPLGAVPISVLV